MIAALQRVVLLTLIVVVGVGVDDTHAQTTTVDSRAALVEQVANARPGTTIKIAPGKYRGGLHFVDAHGNADRPITITAADPDDPPVIQGGTNCIQISRASHLILENLVLEGATGNGLNIDDGGTIDTPTHHVTLKHLVVRDIGPDGNRDGIKLSGVTDFTITDCKLTDWGVGGSGIDMVGCHRGVIRGCNLKRTNAGATGIQCKGGTSKVRILACRFDNAGARHINLGGSTGRQFFRPKLDKNNNAEARELEVAGCVFIGPGAPVAFVGVDGANVHHNTMLMPDPWVMRILQETKGEDFIACNDGVFTDNLIVFKQAGLRTTINIGPNTKPNTFTFERNWWFCADAPGRSTPTLPTQEKDGVYGRDPMIHDDGSAEEQSPAASVGAHAWRERAEPNE